MNLAKTLSDVYSVSRSYGSASSISNPVAFNEMFLGTGGTVFWTYSSGGEMLLGLGIMIPVTRTISRLLVILVLAMSLANLNMYLNDVPFNGNLLSATGHIIRLMFK